MNSDKYTTENLCENCSHHSCCTGFTSPIVYSEDFLKLKKIGKTSDKYLKNVKIANKPMKEIRKKDDLLECIFWDANSKQCSIYEHRPLDCRVFPFDIDIIDGEYHWIVYSCNKDSDWTWSEQYLSQLENEPIFTNNHENIEIFAKNFVSKEEQIPFTVLRKVNFKNNQREN